MLKNKTQKAAFIDRDGTLIEEVNFLSKLSEMRLFPYSAEAVKLLNDNGFLVIVITNQSGVARGIFDEKTLREIHAKLIKDLADSNAKIDAIYFCPHHPDDNCACRKPKTGMILQAAEDFPLDLKNSWMIGDKALDVETGFNIQVKTSIVMTGYGQADLTKLQKKPDLIAENLLEAVKMLISI